MLWERTSTQKKKSTKLTTDQESKLKRRKNWGTEEAEIAAFVNDEIKKGYIQVKDNFFMGEGAAELMIIVLLLDEIGWICCQFF